MLAGLEAILPLFVIIACGYFASRTVLDATMLPAINLFVYYFAVPSLLFRAAMGMSLEGVFYWPGIAGFLLGILLTGCLSQIMLRWVKAEISARDNIIVVMNSTFANFAYMGIPLTFTVLGDPVGPVTVMIILLGNLLIIGGAQVVIEFQRQHQIQLKTLLVILNNALLKSPVFLSTVAGIVFSLWEFGLPAVLEKSTRWLADAAIPVALFCLGAGLKFTGLTRNSRLIPAVVFIKLFCHPALTWLCLQLLGVEDPVWLVATVLLTALPTGALAHVVALKYNRFHEETSQLIVLSTLCSLITVSLWVSVLM